MVDPWTFVSLGLGAGMKAWDAYDAKKNKKNKKSCSPVEGSSEAGPSSNAKDDSNVAAAAGRAGGSNSSPAEGNNSRSYDREPGLVADAFNYLGGRLEGRKGEGSSPGHGRNLQEEYNKIDAERRKREEEAQKKWEDDVEKLMREERDERKRREEIAKADAECAKQEREAREKWEEEMAKLRAKGKC